MTRGIYEVDLTNYRFTREVKNGKGRCWDSFIQP